MLKANTDTVYAPLDTISFYAMISRSVKIGDDVKFEEFVRFIVHEAHLRPAQLDHHWSPQYNRCQPCHIKYDFIGHYETLQHDAEHVLRQISRRSNNIDVQFPATDVDSRNRKSGEFLRKFYGSVSVHNIRRLLRLYKRDYEVFGYKFPDTVGRKLNIQSGASTL